MNEKETQQGTGGLQRKAEGREVEKNKLRKEIKAVREGHATGGYCETEKLQAAEKQLYKILSGELAEAKEAHGYSPDPRFKHKDIRAVEVELHGLCWKPLLVEAAN